MSAVAVPLDPRVDCGSSLALCIASNRCRQFRKPNPSITPQRKRRFSCLSAILTLTRWFDAAEPTGRINSRAAPSTSRKPRAQQQPSRPHNVTAASVDRGRQHCAHKLPVRLSRETKAAPSACHATSTTTTTTTTQYHCCHTTPVRLQREKGHLLRLSRHHHRHHHRHHRHHHHPRDATAERKKATSSAHHHHHRHHLIAIISSPSYHRHHLIAIISSPSSRRR
jgi:hypothetical protein